MSVNEYPYKLIIKEHHGGLVNQETPDLLGLHQSPYMLNTKPLGKGRWGIRNGIGLVGDKNSTAGRLTGFFVFTKLGVEKPIKTYKTTAEYLSSGVWTTLPTCPTFTNNKKFGFAQDKTNVYFGNGVDQFTYWDGSGAVVQTSAQDVPKGNIYAFYLKRLCIAGDPNNPATLYYSVVGDPKDFRVSGGGGSLVIGDSGDDITSIKPIVTPSGDSILLVFKKSSMVYGFKFDSTGAISLSEIKAGTGCIYDLAAIVFENDVMYIDDTNNVQTLGLKENLQTVLQKTQASNDLDGSTPDLDLSTACGWYFKKQKFAIFCGKSYGKTANNVSYAYFTKYNSWWEWSGINAVQFGEYGGRLTWASSVDLNVYQINENYDDLEAPIKVFRDTKDIDLSDFKSSDGSDLGNEFTYKQCRYVYIEGYMSPNSELVCSLIFDENEKSIRSKKLLGTGNQVDKGVSLAFGRKVFASAAFGGSAKTATNFPMKHFTALLSFEVYSFLKMRIRIEQNKSGAPFIITKYQPLIRKQPQTKFADRQKS